MAYGTLKVDNITFTNSGVDQTITVSGIVRSISGNITVTGTVQAQTVIGVTVSGGTVTGDAGAFGTLTGNTAGFTTITGTTVTGTSANFVSGIFTGSVSGTVVRGSTVSGAFVTGDAGQFAVITGSTAGFTTVTGGTVTGTNANFVNGSFSNQISGATVRGTVVSGATVTGDAGQFTTLTGTTAGFSTITGTTVTGTNANFVNGLFSAQVSGTTVRGTTVSGATVTGELAQFTAITGVTAGFTTITGTTVTGTTANFVNGVFTNQVSGATVTGTAGQFGTLTGNTAGFTTITGTTVTGSIANFVNGVFTTQISGATITGNLAQFTTLTGNTAGFTTVTGTTVTGTTANFVNGVFSTQVSGATVTGNVGSFATLNGGTVTLTSGVFGLGTAALPSISFTGDPNTGIYSPGADQVALSTNGTGRLFVGSSGAISIVDGVLDLSSAYPIRWGSGASAIYGSSGSGDLVFTVGSNERMRINGASGRLGIGANAPATLLEVRSATTNAARLRVTGTGTTAGNFRGYEFGNGSIFKGGLLQDESTDLISIFTPIGGQSVNITSAGSVGIGTTGAQATLHVSNPGASNNGTIWLGSATFYGLIEHDAALTGSNIYTCSTASGGGHIFRRGLTEQMRLDANSRLLVGTTSARANFFNSTFSPKIQFEGVGSDNASLSITCNNTSNADSSVISLAKSSIASINSNGLVDPDESLGSVQFLGSDGTEFVSAARIAAEVDGTPGANDMPGRLVFSTTADGAASPTERLRIDSAGQIEASSLGTAAAPVWTFLNDPNTGIYSPGADQLALSTGGTQRLNIDATGNMQWNGSTDKTQGVTSSGRGFTLQHPAAPTFSTWDTTDPSYYTNLTQLNEQSWLVNIANGPLIFGTNANERLRITSAGLVGVGTSSPSRPLHVIGSAVFDDGTTQATIWPNLGSNDAGFGTNTNHPVSIVTNGSRRLNITAAGLVGIGTTAPFAKTDISLTGISSGKTDSANWGANGIVQLINSDGATTGSEILFLGSQAGGLGQMSSGLGFGRSNSGNWGTYLSFYTHSTSTANIDELIERVRIDEQGRVGIGTSSPAYGLEVNNQNIAITNRPSTGTDNPVLYLRRNVESGDASLVGTHGSLAFQTDYLVNGTFVTSSSILAGSATGDNINTYFAFSTTNSGGTLGERMRLTSAGLGIGTTSSSATLHAVGGSTVAILQRTGANACQINVGDSNLSNIYYDADTHYFRAGNGTPRAIIDSSGRVGIGTSAPSTKLEISGSEVATNFVTATTTVASGFSGFRVRNTDTSGRSFDIAVGGNTAPADQANKLYVYDNTANAQRITLDSSGRLGIGTTSPKGKLDCSLSSGELAFFGGQIGTNSGLYTGIAFGYSNNGSSLSYAKSAIVQEQIGDGTSATGKIHILNNNTAGSFNASLADARVTITPAGLVGIGTTSPSALLTAGAAYGGTPNIQTVAVIQSATNTYVTVGAGSSSQGGILFADTAANNAGGVLYSHSTDSLEFLAGGNEAARIDSSRRLLVGTTSAFSAGGDAQYGRFHMVGNTFTPTGHAILALGRGEGASTITTDEALGYITFSDNVGNTFASIHSSADANAGSGDYPGRLVFSTTADGASSPTERMRIDSTGVARFTASTEAPSYRIRRTIAGTPRNVGSFDYDQQSDGSTQGQVVVFCQGNDSAGGGGVALSRGATSWAAYSDERAKTDLVPIDDGLSKVSTLRSVTGRYLDDKPGTSRSFLIAQDVLAVLPEAVDAGDTDKLSLRYTEVIPLLVAALKESKERIETLEAKVAALEAA